MKKFFFLTFIILTVICYTFFANAEHLPLQTTVDSSDVFTDVSEDAWFKSSVDGVLTFSLMDGISAEEFAPDIPTNRATLVNILWRLSGKPITSSDTVFTDLQEDWYVDAVKWAYENNIVNGTSKTHFSPNATLSRETLATILFRYLKYIEAPTSSFADLSVFPDAKSVSSWAQEALSWAYAEGIVNGGSGADGIVRLMPQNSTTRAQVAAMVMRFCEKYQDFFDSSDDPNEDKKFESIKSRWTTQFTRNYYAAKDSNYVLNLRYPSNWKIEKNESGNFTILREEKVIGELLFGKADDLDSWKIVDKQTYDDYYVYVEKYGTGITLRFRYRFIYDYKENNRKNTITITLDYTEANSTIAKRLLKESPIESIYTDAMLGALSELEDKNILIIGNSFIGTSGVGSTLKEMVSNKSKSLKVTAISRGYAKVETYTSDSNLMDRIESGEFDGVFVCGLYSNTQIEHIGIMKDACDESKTTLVIFPAHNESRDTIEKVKKEYPTLMILDWKNEIDTFINKGISKWAFCIDDQHLHSNYLAGYIGAHMIFRAIYNKTPGDISIGTIDRRTVNKYLGDYPDKGCVQLIDKKDFIYFGK
ncbi:MAG: S-layer homology domain-containing protein [Ruminococcaceae bacterium]|nr:S-layer homology domain-containing protein [Oscillospiraceae bacterium]